VIAFDEHVSRKSALDLTPLIDVVFLLLIFFLLTSIYAKPSIPLDLPEAETARIAREPEVSVAIRPDGALMLNDREVSLPALHPALERIYAERRTREISIVSDRKVPFGRVVEVMDAAQRAGAETIAIVTERKRTEGKP
jgi:biopolymer transport protein ExbD